MRKQQPSVALIAIPHKPVFTRLAVVFFLTASFSLLVLSKTDNPIARNLKLALADSLVPVLETISRPFDAAASVGNWIREMSALQAENQALRADNAHLMQWQGVARHLEAENNALRGLLHFQPLDQLSFVTARILGDTGGPYVRSALISSGESQRIKKNQAVVSEYGMVGHVVEVGEKSSRVLLLTDMNSRVPVVTETTRERSILAGDNTDFPTLTYLPADTKVKVGERIVTSGDGGMFPAGLPVGIVSSIDHGIVKIRPLVDWFRLEYVSVVDYSL